MGDSERKVAAVAIVALLLSTLATPSVVARVHGEPQPDGYDIEVEADFDWANMTVRGEIAWTGTIGANVTYQHGNEAGGLMFDHAYAGVKDGQVEIVVHFKNAGGGKLTVVALEVNGIEMVPKGKSPFPIELPSGTNARLRLHASLETFKHGVTYEVAIRTASGGRYVKAVVMP
ncbi:MAG: hypothetical protein JTT11_02930 [Candidatus Brockarchaeota archaeon]|nr:hypothetical protein [Candidatus Brockarchaeota archaeon]